MNNSVFNVNFFSSAHNENLELQTDGADSAFQ